MKELSTSGQRGRCKREVNPQPTYRNNDLTHQSKGILVYILWL